MLSRKLNKYHMELKRVGIAFSKSRSGERRELRLVYTSDDGNDGMTVADGIVRTVKIFGTAGFRAMTVGKSGPLSKLSSPPSRRHSTP